MPQDYAAIAIALTVLWAICAFAHPRTRRALLDGLRCVGRYPDFWKIPLYLGLGYAIFQLAAVAIFQWRMGEDLLRWITSLTPATAPTAASLAVSSAMPAAEHSAAVFTIFTATFPLSAIFALLFVCNARGLLREMSRVLIKRWGRWKGGVVIVLLLLTAICAIAKPAVYLLLPEIAEYVSIVPMMAINFVSVIFELLLGVYFLTYLMLMAYAWRRGLFFTRLRLSQTAMRRAGFVLKWTLLIAAAETNFVILPIYLGIFLSPESELYQNGTTFASWVGRPIVTLLALVFCPAQAILVFHNESLPQAIRESLRLWRTRGLPLILFFGTVYVAFLALEMGAEYGSDRLGHETAAALGSRVIQAWIEATLAGWFIASWVSLYKGLSTGRKEVLF